MEYAGFLDWLWHRGDTPCDVVDLSEVKLFRPHKPGPPEPPPSPESLSVHHDIIAHNKLWDLAEPLPMTERLQYRELWGQLLSENAPLRVLDRGKLVSAPISFFDERLMSLVTDEWQRVVTIFSWTRISYWDEGVDQIGETFLAARMRTSRVAAWRFGARPPAILSTGRRGWRRHDRWRRRSRNPGTPRARS
jgi:hypothetical protein